MDIRLKTTEQVGLVFLHQKEKLAARSQYRFFFSLKGPLRNNQKNVEPEQKNVSDGEWEFLQLLDKGERNREKNSVE